MKKEQILPAVAVAFILLGGYFYFTRNNQESIGRKDGGSQNSQPLKPEKAQEKYPVGKGEMVFFWGEGCSHCVNVEKYFQENGNLDQKLNIKKIEVFNDTKGQQTFMDIVKECKLGRAGVPTFYQDGKCVQGDTPIIEELKKKQ